jgi:hypothetical protein
MKEQMKLWFGKDFGTMEVQVQEDNTLLLLCEGAFLGTPDYTAAMRNNWSVTDVTEDSFSVRQSSTVPLQEVQSKPFDGTACLDKFLCAVEEQMPHCTVSSSMWWLGQNVYDGENWDTAEIHPGDMVEDDLVEDFINCLPPTSLSSYCFQMGEPYAYRYDPETKQTRSVYLTFSRLNKSLWIYKGKCFAGETIERGLREIA